MSCKREIVMLNEWHVDRVVRLLAHLLRFPSNVRRPSISIFLIKTTCELCAVINVSHITYTWRLVSRNKSWNSKVYFYILVKLLIDYRIFICKIVGGLCAIFLFTIRFWSDLIIYASIVSYSNALLTGNKNNELT